MYVRFEIYWFSKLEYVCFLYLLMVFDFIVIIKEVLEVKIRYFLIKNRFF